MSKHFSLTLLVIGLGVALFAAGCQSQTPPKPAATPTDNVVVVVVTATTQPTIAATEVSEPTITPLATFTPIGTLVATATTAPTDTPTRKAVTVVPSTPRPVRTNTPATVGAVASPTTAPSQIDKYPAPTAISPTTGDSNTDHGDIQFYFAGVGPLGANECYLLYVQMVNPNAGPAGVAGDFFLDKNHCGDQSPVSTRLKFVLLRPKFGSPSYGSIESIAQNAAPTDLLKVQWYVRVVQNNGPSPDGVHYNTTPLSPNSATLESNFLR